MDSVQGQVWLWQVLHICWCILWRRWTRQRYNALLHKYSLPFPLLNCWPITHSCFLVSWPRTFPLLLLPILWWQFQMFGGWCALFRIEYSLPFPLLNCWFITHSCFLVSWPRTFPLLLLPILWWQFQTGVFCLGLKTTQDAKFYATSASFDKFSNEGKTLVIQFTVKHEQKIDCGGGYVKVNSHFPYLLPPP